MSESMETDYKFKLLDKIYGEKTDNIGDAYKVIKESFSDRIDSNGENYDYKINYKDPKRRIITLLFEYLDYVHDVYIGDRVPDNLKTHLPWLTHKTNTILSSGKKGKKMVLDHHKNFQDYLSAYGKNPDLLNNLNTMLSSPAEEGSYEFIFKIIYELFTLSGNKFNINQKALDKLAKKYKVSIDQIGNQGSERGLKYILLHFITSYNYGFIKPIYGSLIKEYISPDFKKMYCIFDQSTTCYGLRNLLGRCENVLTYTDKGYSQSSGTILQSLTFEQTGGAVKYKKPRDLNYIISEKNIGNKQKIKDLLKTTQEEEILTTFEDTVTTKIKSGDIQEVTSAPPILRKKVNHLLLNGTITFDIQIDNNTEFQCEYNPDNLSFVIKRNGNTLKDLLRRFNDAYKISGDEKLNDIIKKMINPEIPSSILSAGDCGKLCAVVNQIKVSNSDKNSKNDLLLLLSKSKFMGDYGPILLSSIIPDNPAGLELPYFIHQTGDSSAQNQALALYFASLGQSLDGNRSSLIECTINGEKNKSTVELLLSSDSGLIKTRNQIVVTCHGLALYLSNKFSNLFIKEQGSGKKLRSKKNKINKLKTKNKRKHEKYSKKKRLNNKLSLKRTTQKGGFDEEHDKSEYNENITADNTFVIEVDDLEIYTNYSLTELYEQALERHPVLMKRLGESEAVKQALQQAQIAPEGYTGGPAERAKLRQGPMGSKFVTDSGATTMIEENTVTNPDETVMAETVEATTELPYNNSEAMAVTPGQSYEIPVATERRATKRRATKRQATKRGHSENTSGNLLQPGRQEGPRKTIATGPTRRRVLLQNVGSRYT